MVVIGDDKVTGSVLSLARICELFSLPENIALLVLNGTKSMNSLYTLQPEIVERLRSAQNGIYPVKLGPFVLQGYKGFYDITEMAAGTPGLSEKLKGLPYVKQRDSKLLVEPGQVGGIAVLYDSTIKTQLPPGPAEEPPAGIPPSLVEEVESLEGIIGIQEDEDIPNEDHEPRPRGRPRNERLDMFVSEHGIEKNWQGYDITKLAKSEDPEFLAFALQEGTAWQKGDLVYIKRGTSLNQFHTFYYAWRMAKLLEKHL